MDFLPDSNVLINFFNGVEPDCSFLKELLSEGFIHVSVVSIAEVLSKATADEKEDLKRLCDLGRVEIIDETIAAIAGGYRQNFRRKTKKVYLLDCLLAATCKQAGATLVTNNTADYPMRDIKIIRPH